MCTDPISLILKCNSTIRQSFLVTRSFSRAQRAKTIFIAHWVPINSLKRQESMAQGGRHQMDHYRKQSRVLRVHFYLGSVLSIIGIHALRDTQQFAAGPDTLSFTRIRGKTTFNLYLHCYTRSCINPLLGPSHHTSMAILNFHIAYQKLHASRTK